MENNAETPVRRIIRRAPPEESQTSQPVVTPSEDAHIINSNTTVDESTQTKYAPVEEEEFKSKYETEIAKEMERMTNHLLAYVDEKINYVNDKLLFNGNREPSMYEIDMALMMYEPTLFALIAAYEAAKVDESVAQENFKEWYSCKYMDVRNTYNTKDVKNASWLSAKEIDATLYSKYKKEAATLKADIIVKERERSTIERLLKSWEGYQFILTQLSRNLTAQIQGSLSSVDLKRGDETDY